MSFFLIIKVYAVTEKLVHFIYKSYFFLEQLQIANYGIGGHYEPHFDHAREDEDKFTDLGMGNRIATILYYVSISMVF